MNYKDKVIPNVENNLNESLKNNIKKGFFFFFFK